MSLTGVCMSCSTALSAPRRTRALAAICEQLNDTETCYPGTDLVMHYTVKPHPGTT